MTPVLNNRRRWHLNKDISIDTIIAFILLLMMGVTAWYSQKEATTQNTIDIKYLKETDSRHEQEVERRWQLLHEELKSINEKLDRRR